MVSGQTIDLMLFLLSEEVNFISPSDCWWFWSLFVMYLLINLTLSILCALWTDAVSWSPIHRQYLQIYPKITIRSFKTKVKMSQDYLMTRPEW